MMTEEQAKSLLLKQENVYTRDPQLRSRRLPTARATRRSERGQNRARGRGMGGAGGRSERLRPLRPDGRLRRATACIVNRGKSVMLAVIGTDAPEAGFSIVVSHIDSPRLDSAAAAV
ncbi:MAG: hypothetical protein ACLUFV_03160 [Acutalibacteraceae bacterium]